MATKKKSKKKTSAKKSKTRSATPKNARKKKASVKSAIGKRLSNRGSKGKAKKAKITKTKIRAKNKKLKRQRSEMSFPVSKPMRILLTDDDAQGLSNAESADSESVSELVDEGNAFEAGAVRGVEEADDADEQEVHTHEVSEDDVPEEYLDQD